MATDRVSHFKKIKSSPSVEEFRNTVRKHYREKLKAAKNKELCRRRALFNSTVNYVHESLPFAAKVVLDQELPIEAILQLFEEIEKEVNQKDLQKEAAQYDLYLEKETNAMLDNIPSSCCWCNVSRHVLTKIGDEEVCDGCLELHFTA